MFAKWIEDDNRFAFDRADNGGIEISEEAHAQLFGERAMGKVIGRSKNGKPELQEPPAPTSEQLAVAERAWRNTEIESVKWLRDRHRDELDSARPTTLTTEQSGELLDYVQALRDWPASTDFPNMAARPVPPAWIAEQTR